MGVYSVLIPCGEALVIFKLHGSCFDASVESWLPSLGFEPSPYRGKNGQQRRQCMNHAVILICFVLTYFFLLAPLLVVKRGGPGVRQIFDDVANETDLYGTFPIGRKGIYSVYNRQKKNNFHLTSHMSHMY